MRSALRPLLPSHRSRNDVGGRRSITTCVLTLALFGSISFSGCATSGLVGKVLIGPTCRVARPGQTCLKPYETTLQVRKGTDGPVVARVRSGPDGGFRARLSPGRYVIEPLPGRTPPYASPQVVTVYRHHYSKVTIRFNSSTR
jgi:hypothetical protein